LIIGSSFIGMEIASSILNKAKSITVVGMETVPFERVLGTQVGTIIKKFHEAQGIKFMMDSVVKEFLKDENNQVHTVVLKNDTKLSADKIIIGAGVIPVTNYIKDSPSIKTGRDRSIIVDEYLWTGADGLYAVGDIARFPLAFLHNELVRIEHYGNSQTQAAIAAKNMIADKNSYSFTNVPVFWTSQLGKSIRYAGYALQYDEVVLDTHGQGDNPADPKFAAYYSDKDNIVAVATMQRDPIAAYVAEILQGTIPLKATELKERIKSTGSTNSLLQEKLKKQKNT